jgi:hypothetical protein
MIESDTHCIRRLRFHGRIPNQRVARHRVEVALADAADVSRLRKETILCVRRLAISLPRIDRLAYAFEAELMDAARPARGFVPANANAVLFADRAELLGCLARDWCTGEAANRWWWPALFPRDDFSVVVRRTWLEDARPVPAALARLDAAGLGAAFLAELSSVDVTALWRNIVNTFHIEALAAAWSPIDISVLDQSVVDRSRDSPPWSPSVGVQSFLVPEAARPFRDTPPWSPWVRLPSSLAPESARVLITALLLERAPAVVRSVSFTREIQEWTSIECKARTALPKPSGRTATVGQNSPKTKRYRGLQSLSSSHLSKISRTGSSQTTPPTSLNLEFDCAQPAATARQDSLSFDDSAPPTNVSASSPLQTYRAKPRHRAKDRTIFPDAAVADTDVALPDPHDYDRIQTEWGGVFYLVNVAIALGVYGDFTTPARPGLALPVWDYLALIAGRMIGEDFAADPLPTLLAKLSRRNREEPPAAYFEPEGGELLADWVERNCRDIDRRLTAALAIDDPAALHALVLNHIARVEARALRLDVHFSLATHPIELRMAGLDRDPGWVPAGGRSIYFHYD